MLKCSKFKFDLLKKEEAKLFFNHIENTDLVILLDEKGKRIYQQRICSEIELLSKQFHQKSLLLIGGFMVFLMKCTTEPMKIISF